MSSTQSFWGSIFSPDFGDAQGLNVWQITYSGKKTGISQKLPTYPGKRARSVTWDIDISCPPVSAQKNRQHANK